jgi:hypothetical protein
VAVLPDSGCHCSVSAGKEYTCIDEERIHEYQFGLTENT